MVGNICRSERRLSELLLPSLVKHLNKNRSPVLISAGFINYMEVTTA